MKELILVLGTVIVIIGCLLVTEIEKKQRVESDQVLATTVTQLIEKAEANHLELEARITTLESRIEELNELRTTLAIILEEQKTSKELQSKQQHEGVSAGM